MTIRVDSTVLEAESSALSCRAGEIESLAGSIPSAYDAGDAAPLIAAILATYSQAGSDLACGITSLSGALAMSEVRYANTDLDTADALNAAQWEGTK